MSLREETNSALKARRQRLVDGGVNTIPSPFRRFSQDFLGWEQSTYYIDDEYPIGYQVCCSLHGSPASEEDDMLVPAFLRRKKNR